MTYNIMRDMHPSNDESRGDETGVENATDTINGELATPNGYEKNESRICKTSQYKF